MAAFWKVVGMKRNGKKAFATVLAGGEVICAPVEAAVELVDRGLVVGVPNKNPPPAAVPAAVPVAPIVPVHDAPVGQQAT